MYVPESRFRLGNHGARPLPDRWEAARARLIAEVPSGHKSRSLLTAMQSEETIDRIEHALLDYQQEHVQTVLAERNARPRELLEAEQKIGNLQRRYHAGCQEYKRLDNKLRPFANSTENLLMCFIPEQIKFPVQNPGVAYAVETLEQADEHLDTLRWNVSVVEAEVARLQEADRVLNNMPIEERAWVLVTELVKRVIKLETQAEPR